MNDEVLLLGFPESMPQARALAEFVGLPMAAVDLHRFPDGESRVRLPVNLPPRLVFCRSLDHPDDKLIGLILAAAAAREQGAVELILVAPYLAYMRQDIAFTPGEAVSQRLIGRLLVNYFDGLLTVDAHLHRVHRLEQAVPVAQARNLTATAPMARFLAGQPGIKNPLLLGPDAESRQWVAAIAEQQGLEYRVAHKERLGDRKVRVQLPEGPYAGRDLVLVDDVASTGRTLEMAARALARHRPASISVLVTHALFLDDAVTRLKTAGVANIWSCDSIEHPSNAVPLAPLLGAALQRMLGKNCHPPYP
ncbi:MAG: ribose-phosphate diphosphokinase [Gammaproteobacteria bacterium]|nr:ribose-phosphate diphosphokinase [Gammaproteobacteria bacterium]MBU1654961.1 ribose-phosphate diphosphokinase [Gammaproteobacteria bacterium]MBU1960073.1 ribose-phosphate diphosphokinase [Gammaproteobacteria bacterium]